MTAIFETADHAVFIREIEDATPEYHFAIARPYSAHDYDPFVTPAPVRQRTYQLFDVCHRIALYREKVV